MLERLRRWREARRWERTVKQAQQAMKLIDVRMKAQGMTRQQRRQVWSDLLKERRPNL